MPVKEKRKLVNMTLKNM